MPVVVQGIRAPNLEIRGHFGRFLATWGGATLILLQFVVVIMVQS